MSHNPHHEHLMEEIKDMLGPMLDDSPQAIYVYLDDEHKLCNKKFATMLGYKSIQEWVDNPYPVDDLDENSQKSGIQAYMNASEKFKASLITGTWKTKSGKKIKTNVIMAPFTYQDETFVLHFISPA